MRSLILISVLALCACATPLGQKPEPGTWPFPAAPLKAAGTSVHATATLATNPCEVQTSPEITALADLLRTTAHRVDVHMITPAVAREVMADADAARDALIHVCAVPPVDPGALVQVLIKSRQTRAAIAHRIGA